MRPTFAGFYVAKQGLDVARANLQVTGQNMTNAGTIGYTRQRVDTYAVGTSISGMRYANTEAFIGEGVRIGGVSQIRDPYLDVRYRREHAKFGDTGTQYAGLNDLDDVLNKTTTDRIGTQLSDLVTQLRELSKKPSDPVSERIVKTSATTLLQMINNAAGQIKRVREENLGNLRDGALVDANYCLSNIAQLNEAIKSANVSGNPALELIDERNNLIDTLSQYCNIEVNTKLVDVGEGVMVEELSVNMIASNGDKFNLVDNSDFKQFQLLEGRAGNPDIGIQLVDSKGSPIKTSMNGSIMLQNGDISGQLTTGSFHGSLKLLNDKGEFGNPPSQERGIAYYEGMLDNFANTFAKVFNDANGTDKPLFASSVDGEDINASNIVISSEWQNATDNYITSRRKDPITGIVDDKEGSNILYMISLFTDKQSFTTPDITINNPDGTTTVKPGQPLFNGTFHDMLTNVSTTLGLQVSSVSRQHKASVSNMTDIDTQRQSVSGVNVDDEGINLIMYNQALTAASRYMTTLDEAVETIISKMGIVGR